MFTEVSVAFSLACVFVIVLNALVIPIKASNESFGAPVATPTEAALAAATAISLADLPSRVALAAASCAAFTDAALNPIEAKAEASTALAFAAAVCSLFILV